MEYELKRGRYQELQEGGLRQIVEEVFGNVLEEGQSLVASFGALTRLETRLLDKSTLLVNTTSNPSVAQEAGLETIRRYNLFLERATGFTSKERRNRLQKKAKEGKL
ncbi:MAG: hypothetical protein FJ151_02315 [Euryarchaeota archaeon]|nr:hypothetical protein [Euryarchaeota archaeon]